MGTDIITDEDIEGEPYGWVSVSDIDWDATPPEGRVIGSGGSEKYECGDIVTFDAQTLKEIEGSEESDRS